jgi:hypothetical protein
MEVVEPTPHPCVPPWAGLFSLVASGQIKLRKIDGWQKIAAVLSQHTAVAA